MISYALGDAGTGLAAIQLGTYLFLFFTCAAGIPAFIAGSLLMVSKLWDALNDPLIGWLSDHTQSRWGPRLPWMLGGAVPLGLFLAAMWWVPPGNIGAKTTYYIFAAILLMTAYTAVNLPFAALSTELTENTAIRTRLNAARFTGSILAGTTGLVVAAGFLSRGVEGYTSMGRVTGLIATFTTLIACWGLAPFAKKARRPISQSEPFQKQLKRVLNNKLFTRIIALYLLLWCGLQLMQTVSLIYLEQVMLVPIEVSKWIPIPFQISTLLGLQFWSFYSNKYGRITALFKGGKIWISACFLVIFMPPITKGVSINNLLLFDNFESIKLLVLLIIILLLGFGASTAYLIPWSLLPDAIDQDPEKPSGIYTAWMVFIQKIGIGLSVQLLGVLLSLAGYKSSTNCLSILGVVDQPLTAIITIRLCMGLIPSLLVIAGLITMKPWQTLDFKNKKVIQ
tara:strand:- start:2309 stop:3664 length:1356 start_codon:yes stop_codon:yes gene_type:complete